MLVSAEELAWALDTHVDYAQAVLDRIRCLQRREPYIPPLPVAELVQKINRQLPAPDDRETLALPTVLRRSFGRKGLD